MNKMFANPWDREGEYYPEGVVNNNWKKEDFDILNEYSKLDNFNDNESNENIFSGNSFSINGKKLTISDLRVRHQKIKNKMTTAQLNSLTKQEKLILDLPIIMANLGWLYSAYCQLHWLEALGDTVVVPYDFPFEYNRAKESIITMKANIKKAKYASINEYNNLVKFSLDGSASYLLYDFDIESCQKAYDKAIKYLKTIVDYEDHIFGNFNFDEPPEKLNLIRSYVIGSKFGDLDDLGGSFGRFSLRVYVKGKVKKQEFANSEWNKFYLNITEVGIRFIDQFNFEGEQYLGAWKHDIINSELPNRLHTPSGWIDLTNADYQRLSNRNLGIGQKFIIQSEVHYLTNDMLKTSTDIVFFFAL